MFKKILKSTFFSIFKGLALPVYSKQLKGVKLIIDPLMPNFHFWKDVEIEAHFIYDTFIKDGDTVFDIGGNVGLHSSYITNRFKQSKIVAFEPLPENAQYFRKVISLNKFANIQLVEKAIGKETGKVFFDRDKNNHQGHITAEHSDLSVDVVTLDDFIATNQISPNFIKVDVEGFEGDVVDGYFKTVSLSKPFMLIEIHSMEQAKRVGHFFRTNDYAIYRLADKSEWKDYKPLSLVPNIPAAKDEAPEGLWGQILAIPNSVKEQYNHLYN
jgi:FkbM family methyltransferase